MKWWIQYINVRNEIDFAIINAKSQFDACRLFKKGFKYLKISVIRKY